MIWVAAWQFLMSYLEYTVPEDFWNSQETSISFELVLLESSVSHPVILPQNEI